MTLLRPRHRQPANLGELLQWFARREDHPVDALHVAAVLESDGWDDSRAVAMGYPHVFSLAEDVFVALKTRHHRENYVPRPDQPWYAALAGGISHFIAGPALMAPHLLLAAAVLAFYYAGGPALDAAGQTLGVITAFSATGGFALSIARRGCLLQPLEPERALRNLQYLEAGTAAIGVAGASVLLATPGVPAMAAFAYAAASLSWLGFGLLYALRRHLLLALGAAACLLFTLLGAPLPGAALVGGAAVLAAVYLGMGQVRRPLLPGWELTVRTLSPYLLFGALLGILLLADRMVARIMPGAAPDDAAWYLGHYELGLHWAALTLIVPLGLVELYLQGLGGRIAVRQRSLPAGMRGPFNFQFLREHTWHSLLVILGGIVNIFAVVWAASSRLVPDDPLTAAVTQTVFFIAAPSLTMLAVSLQNCYVLFGLGLPWPAARAAAWSALAALAAAFAAGRFYGAEWTVLGLAAGAVAFSLSSTLAAQGALRRLDFHLFRAS